MIPSQNSDSEPLLLACDSEAQELPSIHRPSASVSTSIKRLNRRQLKLLNQERCGRIRLVALVVVLFLTIYYSFVTSVKEPKQLLVIIPPDDVDLPGPKGVSFWFIQPVGAYDEELYFNALPMTPTSEMSTITTTTSTSELLTNTTIPPNSTSSMHSKVPKGYLVYSPGCRMIDLNPYEKDVMKLFTKESLMKCKEKPLTRIHMNYETNQAVLVVNQTLAISEYLDRGQRMIDCCYQNIMRSGVNESADNHYELSKCTYFTESIELMPTDEYILVKCKSSFKKNAKVSYTDAHATIRESKAIRKRLNKYKKQDTNRPASVLMIGIDSISRLNLIRAMPKTAQHLYDTGWFEFRGYNKVDDNTYPNLMAILVGYNNSLAYSTCNPKEVGKLDNCPFMWKYFRENGYVTGYAEDAVNINTFNYNKKGFVQPPTDHYFRPFAMAAEKNLPNKLKSSLKFCLGYKTYADYIYQYALDFATTYKNETSFGLFWTNTFSHNDISDPSSMDEKIKHYIEELETREILNNSIVIFWSDHGLRFGPVRYLLTGWLEERLPFFFMWLPPWFREQHPQIVQNLKINRNRLTNPYDLHMTLKHILELSGRIDNIPGAKSCPNCQSLFNEVPWNRTCDEIGIEAHWCTCSPYVGIKKTSPIVVDAVKFAVKYINNLLDETKNGAKPLCAPLKLKTISLSKQSKLDEVSFPYSDILVIFETQPGGGKFEATIRYYEHEKRYEITGTISRLNTYGTEGGCVDVDYMKKYCVCLKKKKKH